MERSGCGEETVPLWERKFCKEVGRIPWRSFLELKKLSSYYPSVLQWDDSAGEEAFQNAKARFWAKENRLPCDIPLPDRKMYIDTVDRQCRVDPKLLADLDDPLPPINEEGCVVLGIEFINQNNQSFSGWGDAEVPARPSGWCNIEDSGKPSGWGDAEAHKDKPTGWENGQAGVSDGWDAVGNSLQKEERSLNKHADNGWDDRNLNKNNGSDGWNDGGWNNGWECHSSNRNATDAWHGGERNNGWGDNSGWGQWNGRNNQESVEHGRYIHPSDNRDWSYSRGSNHQFSRYKVSRYQDLGDDYHLKSSGWRNGGSRKRGGIFDKPEVVKQRQLSSWNGVPSCRTGNFNNKRGYTDAWGWKKPVS